MDLILADFPFELNNQTALGIGAGLLVVTLWTVVTARKRLEALDQGGTKGKGRGGGDLSERLEEARIVRDSLHDLLLRLEETSRRVGAGLDTRMAMLNRLLADADMKINALSQRRQSAEAASAASHLPETDPQTAEIYRLADAGMDALAISRKVDRPRGEVDVILSLRRLSS